ncbi:XVIPCD domain-containing protein [Stenotrophomonas sp. 3(2025)]|uniref:XVIPCD domain-containing protein n=1 Tax=Stenotrophomonas sp. 3(2025) TaxID=3456023 RepID=UPI0040446670
MNARTSKEGATQDAPRDAASASFDPTYTSANSEVRAAAGGYSVTLNEGDGALKVGTEHKRAASSLAAQFQGTSLNMAGSPTPDGGRDYLLTMESVVGASAKGAGFQDTSGTGVRGRYRVSLPSEAVDVDPTRINPFDPQTIPKGGSVTLDGQQFTGTALEGSFRNIAMQSQTTEASGASYRVDRLDDGRVRVSTGPNEAVEAFNGMGFSAGRFSAIAGRQDALGHAAVRTATFDLDQAEGRQAYEQFIDNGTLSGQTPGVQDLATVERLGVSSQTRLKVGYGDTFGLDLAGARNSGDVVQVSREDGSRTELRSVQYNGNLPATRVSAYGADGQEDRAQRRYEFTFDLRGHAQGEQIAGMVNAALSGDPSGDRGPVKAGELTTLSFSEAQMRTLMERTQSMVGDNPMLGPSWQVLAEDGNGRPQQDVDAFALGLARNQGQSTYGMAERLFHIAAAGGKDLQKIDAAVQGEHLQSLAPPSPLLPRQDPRHTASPDHGMWLQSQGAVSSLDQAMGRQGDEMSERLGMALLVAAKGKGMQRIDEAVLSDDGRYAFAVQGQPHAADRQVARTDTAQAVATPVEDQVRQLQDAPERTGAARQDARQQGQVVQEQAAQEQAARTMAR